MNGAGHLTAGGAACCVARDAPERAVDIEGGRDAKGRISVKLSSEALTVNKQKQLVEFLERLLH